MERIAGYMGEADGLDSEDATLALIKINLFLRLGWEHFWHPETMEIEARTFRAAYDAAAAYAAPTTTSATEVYLPGDGNYYQALRSCTGQAPATYAGGSWTVNASYWALSQASYSGEAYAARAFAVGDVAVNPSNQRCYACHTAHAGGDAMDLSQFGILTPFVRSIDYEQELTAEGAPAEPIGLVRWIWNRNPQVQGTGFQLPIGQGFHLRSDCIQVLGRCNLVWLEFQRRAPVLGGAMRSDALTYGMGTQVYDAATGDFWVSLEAIEAGESPTTHPEKWERVPFPYYLAEFVAQSAYASLTNREQEQPENFQVQMAAGYPLLQQEMDNVERRQGQVRQLRVVK